MPLEEAINNKEDIVSLNDSQILRWICELNGLSNLDYKVNKIKKKIRDLKKEPNTTKNKYSIRKLYKKLYSLQYQKDYFCMIMNSNSDYDRANKGFKINGYGYRRLLGTNGGIKKSTITYIGENVFDEIKKRMDNGRNKNKEIIPAKLEAYQALICSGSTPVTQPKFIVVNDCNVKFTDDVIKISDDGSNEPLMEYIKDYEIEYCDSDGYGFMSPEYSRKINHDLYGDEYGDTTISGVNTRYAWTKGMLFTFDFVEFAKRINNGNYTVIDAWGDVRDVRDYDVIFTTSMVKLWDSYDNLEHFVSCCNENHYQFSVAKTTPHKLENTRNANYQFLQTYELSDEELQELCQPTIDEIMDVLGGDWRKTIVFAKGMFLNEENILSIDNDVIKALMIEPELINDQYVINTIHSMIRKRIDMAAKGSIKLSGNFAIVSGDLYSLAQSMFGLPVTGLLKKGEVYHKYWIDKGVEDIALFRAPMTCHNNIRRVKVTHNNDMDFWYKYDTTGIILNSWDTICDATNGSDKDGDMFFTTDNQIIVNHTLNSPTIECVQRKAEKRIPTERDMVEANKLAFGDEIGTTTNRITAMIERQSFFDKDSEEYKILDYRIKCGQHFQQCAIDKAKGIIANPMPLYWYDRYACLRLPENTDSERDFKKLCIKIVASSKPYFMKYVYPDLMLRSNKYMKDTNSRCIREFGMSINDFLEKHTNVVDDYIHRRGVFERDITNHKNGKDETFEKKEKDKEMSEEERFVKYYFTFLPTGNNPCLVNRITWIFEDIFKSYKSNFSKSHTFDYTILKSKECSYRQDEYDKVIDVKIDYDSGMKHFRKIKNERHLTKDDSDFARKMMKDEFKRRCLNVCSNESKLCNIIIDLCYSSSENKQFAWDICGETIINNLLEMNNYMINYPLRVDSDGDFSFGGEQFKMVKRNLKEMSDHNNTE